MPSRKQRTPRTPRLTWLLLPLLVFTVGIIGIFGTKKTKSPVLQQSSSTMQSSESSQVSSAAPVSEAAPTPSEAFSAEPVEPAPPAPAGMQLQQIQAGDYTSLIGTWVNGQGYSLTFDATGLVEGSITDAVMGEDQLLRAHIYHNATNIGVTAIFVPQGIAIPTAHFEDGQEFADASDQSRDRILLTQSLTGHSDPSAFYYKQ